MSAALLVFRQCVRDVFGPPTARLALLLATGVATIRLYDGVSINPDFYAFVFELIAASCLTVVVCRDPGRRHWIMAAGAGLAFAAASAVKQVAFVGLLAAAVFSIAAAAMHRFKPGKRVREDDQCSGHGVLHVLAMSAGFACGIGIVIFVLAWNGVLAEAWYAIFTYSSRYLPASPIGEVPFRWPRVEQDLAPVQLWVWLAGVGALAVLARGVQKPPTRWAGIMLLWVVLAAWFAMHGPSMAMRYWHGVWAPMLWLAAAGIEALRGVLARSEKSARLTIGIAYVTLILLLAWPYWSHYRLGLAEAYLAYTRSPNERERLAEVGRAIAESVPDGESIYIWAYDIGPYLYAERRPASRFTYPRSIESAREVLETLEAEPPYALLMPERSSSFFAQWCDEECDGRLGALLERYSRSGSAGLYAVYLRLPTAGLERNAQP